MTKATTTDKPKKTGRQAAAGTAPAESPEILPAVAERIEAGQDWQLTCQQAARDEAQRLGYLLPAESADPDLIQRDIAANMRRSVDAVLEIGKGLIVLKAACGYGNFKARLQVLGLEARLAQRFMQAAVKFSNASLTTHLIRAAGNQTKLFELLVLDDESIQALEEEGVTASGLTLDDIDRMSTSELRAALREAKAEASAKDDVLKTKTNRIDALELEVQRIKRLPPDGDLADLQKKATACASDVEGAVWGDLREALIAVQEHTRKSGQGRHQDVFMAGLIGQVQARLDALRDEFNLFRFENAQESARLADIAEWAPQADE